MRRGAGYDSGMRVAGALVVMAAAFLAPLLLVRVVGPWAAPAGALGVLLLWSRAVPVTCRQPGGSLAHSLAGMLLLLNVPLTLILAVVV